MPGLQENIATALQEQASEPSDVQKLRKALANAVDSLEYVERAHVGISGHGVRQLRIMQANAVLEETREQ